MQELVQQSILQIKKVAGASNPVLLKHLGALGVGYPFGRVA